MVNLQKAHFLWNVLFTYSIKCLDLYVKELSKEC